MQPISIEVPDTILEFYQTDLQKVKLEIQQSFVIWEYLNGHLSLHEASNLLNVSYRYFLELLWRSCEAVKELPKITFFRS